MLAFISIFDARAAKRWAPPLLVLGLLVHPARAQAETPKEDRTLQPEEDDFGNTPFTEYGEFNEEADEEQDNKFMQYGRLFGVSLGLGFQGVTGQRGAIYDGGFPLIDLKVHYWFDFNLAMDMNVFTVAHHYTAYADGVKTSPYREDVTIIRLGLDLKYYFETKNLSSAISFANPYVLIGGGYFSKTQVNSSDQVSDSDSAIGLTAGAGLEFPLKQRKAYFALEGTVNTPRYPKDIAGNNDVYARGVTSLEGLFYTVTGSFLFTW